MKINACLLLLFSMVLSCSLCGSAAALPDSQQSNRNSGLRPNIVLILADQWRAQAFGYAGDPNVKTPCIDRLQRESFQFVNAVSGMPVCCPYRASLLTGRRPLTHGVFMNDVSLNPSETSIAEVLRDSGYDTACIGKWHVDGHGRSSFIPKERRQGFDYWKVLECTHNYSNSFYYADSPEKMKWEGYDAIAQTRDAQQYIRDHAGVGRPYFLFLSWGPPHDPYQIVPENYRALYPPHQLILPPNIPVEGREKARRSLQGYYAHCTALDECLGEVRKTLRETGQDKNTLLLFTSDHGDLLGSHGAYNKQQPYNESIRVPLLFHWPAGLGLKTKKLKAMINVEDLMPTLLGLVRLPIPDSVEGKDYSRYIRGGADPSGGYTWISCVAPFGQWLRRSGGREYRGIVTDRYTYVRTLDGPWLLFDNRKDPYQMHNLVDNDGNRKTRIKLESYLQRDLRDKRDQFMPAADYIRKWGYSVDATGTVPYAN